MGDLDIEPTWYYTALAKADNKCQNCGSEDSVTAKLIVPEEAGGQKVATNCTVLCKTCRFLSEKTFKSELLPTSFFLSQSLYARLVKHCAGTTSIASVIRVLISVFLADPVAFESVWSYQEAERDVKVNVQVDLKTYGQFKELLANERRTVQEAMVALLTDYLDRMENINV